MLFILVALGLIVGGIVFFQQASTAGRVAEQTRVMANMYSELRAVYRMSG